MPVLHIKLSVDPGSPHPAIQNLMKTVRPEWKTIQMKTFTDGLTNTLFGVYETSEKEMVLVRVYGQGTEKYLDRKRELRLLEILHQSGVSQPVYASFQNGICYGYIQGTVFTDDMMRDIKYAHLVAKTMARLHTIPVPEDIREGNNNIPVIFTRCREMLNLLPKKLDNKEHNKQYQGLINVSKLKEDLVKLERLAASYGEQLLLCHHDLLNRNLVYSEEEDKVYFIDFEFTDLGHSMVDMGVHFMAYMGMVEVDKNAYPSKEHQLLFLQTYLTERNKYLAVPVEVNEKVLEEWHTRVGEMSLVALVYWGLWCILQSLENSHEYGFFEMGHAMIEYYMGLRDQVLLA